MFRVSPHPSSGVLKTVAAASSTGHNIGRATSLQRGQIWPRCREVAVPICKYFVNLLTPNDPYMGRTAQQAPNVAFYVFIQQI